MGEEIFVLGPMKISPGSLTSYKIIKMINHRRTPNDVQFTNEYALTVIARQGVYISA